MKAKLSRVLYELKRPRLNRPLDCKNCHLCRVELQRPFRWKRIDHDEQDEGV